MLKQEISRDHLKENMMKNIIFKIDYQGITDIEAVVESFKKWANGKFLAYAITFQNRIDLQFNNIEEISKTLSIPVKEITQKEIHRFSENTFGSDKLVFDISKYFTALNILCSNYQKIDEYLDFFASFVDFLYSENEYLSIKRMGLRKIGGQIYYNTDDIHQDFEKKYFNFDFTETVYKSDRSRYTDVLVHDSQSPIINYTRTFETGLYYNQDTKEESQAYQVTLDIDGYFSEELLKANEFGSSKAKSLLETTNHTYLFDIFKMSVTEKFLTEHSK